LNNGGVVTGSISVAGEVDSYSFAVQAGEVFQIRATDTVSGALTPEIRVYNTGGALVQSSWGASVADVGAAATASGSYTLEIHDRNNSATGPYKIEYTRAPGANEGGALPNGSAVSGAIDLGDLDSYTFAANAGDALLLRVGDVGATSLTPEITLYTPNGTTLGYSWGEVAAISTTATANGIYTVVVGDRNLTGAGPYELSYVRAPGANEGGALSSSASLTDSISLSDLDSYTFSAAAGEDFQVRVADIGGTTLSPEIYVYSPIGALLSYAWSSSVASISETAPLTGAYTVVVADRNLTGAGAYELNFTHRPGANEGGVLPLGGSVSGDISLGDLDSYTFDASWGQSYQIRVAEVGSTSLSPEISVYSPNGALVNYAWSSVTAAVSSTATATGVYTVVVGDRNTSGSGPYELHFTRAPGANELGELPNGGVRIGALTLGDLDSYRFEASWGQSYQLRVVDLLGTGLTPEVTVYGPAGGPAGYAWDPDVARIALTPGSTGTFTVVVGDRNTTGSGVYAIYFARAPGANEGGLIANGAALSGYLDRGELDSFTLQATIGEAINLTVSDSAATSLTPEVFVYGPGGELTASTWSTTTATINTIAPATGVYTIVVADRNGTGVGLYGVGFPRDVQTYCTAGVSASGCTASMSAIGDPSVGASNGFAVLATGVEGNKDGLFFFGTNGRQAIPWGNGTSFQCVSQPVIRSPVFDGVGATGACNGYFALDFNAYAQTLAAGAPTAGSQVQIQSWYRDPGSTANVKTSLSDALEFTMQL